MTTAALPEHALTAAADLRAIREQWGDLLDAIEQRPADQWPPVDNIREHLATPAADDEPTIGRLPLVLRQHPAPANLDALDAAVDTEREIFGMCDFVAGMCQLNGRSDENNPRRWTPIHSMPGRFLPGSRRHGLHWACVWLEGRALGEDPTEFLPLPTAAAEEVARLTREGRRRVERALARAGRRTDLVDPCPWCHGQLLARTVPGGEPSVTCQTGAPCPAPVDVPPGCSGRTWRGADLAALWTTLHAARGGRA